MAISPTFMRSWGSNPAWEASILSTELYQPANFEKLGGAFDVVFITSEKDNNKNTGPDGKLDITCIPRLFLPDRLSETHKVILVYSFVWNGLMVSFMVSSPSLFLTSSSFDQWKGNTPHIVPHKKSFSIILSVISLQLPSYIIIASYGYL